MKITDSECYEILSQQPGLTFLLTADDWELNSGPAIEYVLTLACHYARGDRASRLTWPDLLPADYKAQETHGVVQEIISQLVSEDVTFVLLWHVHGEDEIHANHSTKLTERAAHNMLQDSLVSAFEEQFVWLEPHSV